MCVCLLHLKNVFFLLDLQLCLLNLFAINITSCSECASCFVFVSLEHRSLHLSTFFVYSCCCTTYSPYIIMHDCFHFYNFLFPMFLQFCVSSRWVKGIIFVINTERTLFWIILKRRVCCASGFLSFMPAATGVVQSSWTKPMFFLHLLLIMLMTWNCIFSPRHHDVRLLSFCSVIV